MKLTNLGCQFTQVSDLPPLKDMKLTYLFCQFTQVADLSPLKGRSLTHLNCGGTKVTDLSPQKEVVSPSGCQLIKLVRRQLISTITWEQ